MPSISYISIGTELLKGRIVNTNAAAIGAMLRQHGYALNRVVAIGDTRQAIAETIEAELATHDVVLVSGGLGPTLDDITKQTLAELFGMKLVEHAPTTEHLRRGYEKLGRELTERNARQAWVPDGCEVITNWHGTAPGMLFRRGGKLLFSGPGVPFELLKMVENGWLPELKAAFPIGTYIHRIVRLFDVAESDVADRLAPVEATFPAEVDIAYLPRMDGLWLEFSVNGDFSAETAAAMLEETVAKVKPVFGGRVYAEGSEPMEVLLGKLLKEKGLTIAVAESLTGGSLSARIVSVSGASHYYRGGVTAYSAEIKTSLLGISPEILEKEGVVSETVARLMAERVRELLGADIGIGTTGMAEVSNPTLQGDAPHAWIGYADSQRSYAEFRRFFYRDRALAIDRVVNTALYFALRENR